MDLELPTRTLRPGGTITGKVVLRPTRAMTVNTVVATFAQTIPVKEGLVGKAVGTPQILVDEPLDLEPGDTRSLPFALTLPDDAAPTVRGSMTTPPCHSIVSWDVGGQAKFVLSADDKAGSQGFVYVGVNVCNTDAASSAAPGRA
ncbi:MAG TPA: sporulation protein [Acidimicrobiales bacterium]